MIERRLFTLEEYEKLIEIGFLGKYDKVELVNGEILNKTPITPSHAACVNRLNRQIFQLIDDSIILSIQMPISLPSDSLPEPDVALIREFDNSSGPRRAGPADILLLVEVADLSIKYDREVKIPLYAAAGIPEVWLVDLTERCIEVHSTPCARGYHSHQLNRDGHIVQSATMPDIAISVEQILGVN